MMPANHRPARRLFEPRIAASLMLAASLAILGTVFAMQYLGGLAPCELCVAQRWPYGAAIAFTLLALIPAAPPRVQRVLLGLAGVAFIATAAIGFYHAGVELKVFEGPSACTSAISANTVEDLRRQLLAAPVVRCDEVQWSLFGITLAGYNFIVAAGLAAFSLGAALRGGRASGREGAR
jgi:disulfide bond formation protein DsbB